MTNVVVLLNEDKPTYTERYVIELANIASTISANFFEQMYEASQEGSIAVHLQIARYAKQFLDATQLHTIDSWEDFATEISPELYFNFPCWDDALIAWMELKLKGTATVASYEVRLMASFVKISPESTPHHEIADTIDWNAPQFEKIEGIHTLGTVYWDTIRKMAYVQSGNNWLAFYNVYNHYSQG
jgi:hypothetical protein